MDLLDIPFGTRFIGYWGDSYGNQIPVTTYKEIKDFIEEHNGIDNIGISICTYKDNEPYLLFLPFDFDSDDLKTAWDDATKLFEYIANKGYSTCIVFSGRKGFHVYIQTLPKVYNKNTIRDVQSSFKELLDLKTMDVHIQGDIRRLMRVVYTYNINGDLCRIIESSDGKLLDLDSIVISRNKHSFQNNGQKIVQFPISDYPCIEFLIKDRNYWMEHHPRKKFEPAQEIRACWVAIRNSQGRTSDQVFEEAKTFGWDDWNENKTRYQIEHIIDHKYVPHSCYSLKKMGYCIIKNCNRQESSGDCYLRKLNLI